MGRQKEKLKVALLLEKMGHHITEYYTPSGKLWIYVDGKPMRLERMIRLWRSR